MSKSLNLTKDPIGPLLKKIAIPASVGTLFQTLFNIVDTFFAGKISPEALSALAKSFPIYFIIIARKGRCQIIRESEVGGSVDN